MFLKNHANKAKPEDPIVFVPGLFGSLGEDVLPGTGDFSFGLAESVYRPLIENLEVMGFKEDENLFVAYYNWRQKNQASAEQYLIPTIRKAKETTGTEKVNLICHSMGGIVARAYIQSNMYHHDVNKLIMMATPHYGSVNAYYFWGGGELPYEKLKGNLLYRIIREVFLWVFKLIYGEEDDLKIFHKMVPSVEELLPSHHYGDYLFYQKERLDKYFLSIDEMTSQNTFLNSLNHDPFALHKAGIKTYLLSGTGVETNQRIAIEKENNTGPWTDGMPKYTEKTKKGDGTVITKSSVGIYGIRKYIKADHTEIVKGAKGDIAKILSRNTPSDWNNFKPSRYKYRFGIITNNIDTIDIEGENYKKTLNGDAFHNDINTLSIKIKDNLYCILLKSYTRKKTQIRFTPQAYKEGHIIIVDPENPDYIKSTSEIKGRTVVDITL